MTEIARESLYERLFAAQEARVYALLDGAAVDGLLSKLYAHQPRHECLYRGELEPDIAETAPYLIQLEREAELTRWVLEEGWGKHWGVFAVSEEEIDVVRRHFRKFLVVHDSAGKPHLFRYYDPRVLRVYLPTCNRGELETIFGPMERFVVEDEDPARALCFELVDGELRTVPPRTT